jgi:iron(III) transport system substrate-binding protein
VSLSSEAGAGAGAGTGRGKAVSLVSLGLFAALSFLGCPRPPEIEIVTVYSGRGEALVGPLFDRFTRDTGIQVRARYGDSAELAATLLEEGPRSPADLFISQDAAALGALAERGRLHVLPEELTVEVPGRFRDSERRWVGLSGRARTVVYHTDVAPEELPRSLEEIAAPRFRGRFGIAPANASFQSHMAVYRAVHGAQGLEVLLQAIAENRPRLYDKNQAIVEAVATREIDWGLTNHYYVWRALDERPHVRVASFFMPEGEASSFINVAGVGLLSDRPAALQLVSHLLSPDSQLYFAEETFEYPVLPEVAASPGLPPIEELRTPDVDFGEVAAVLEETLMAIRVSGLLR